jgi:hypothetical protein
LTASVFYVTIALLSQKLADVFGGFEKIRSFMNLSVIGIIILASLLLGALLTLNISCYKVLPVKIG